MNASHVYVRALALSCFCRLPNLSEGADRVAGQLRGDKECPFSGVTKSGRVWRKVSERDYFLISIIVRQYIDFLYSLSFFLFFFEQLSIVDDFESLAIGRFCPASLKSLGCFNSGAYFLHNDNKFAKFTVPTLKAFLKGRSQNVSGNKQ